MVGSVAVALLASRPDGRPVRSEEFLLPLGIDSSDAVEAARADAGPWSAGQVCFPTARLGGVDGDPERHQVLAADVRRALLAAATFLDRRDPSVTAAMARAGLKLQLFIGVWMDQDQMELELPPVLVAACGRHRIGVHVMSNDIAADEAVAMRGGVQ